MVQVVYLYDVYPTHCHARLGVQYQCESLTSRCQGGAISVYPTPWPPTCSGVLPSWCTFEVASLLVVTEEAAIVDVPGRNSQCTCQRRGKRWDHSPVQGFSQQWYKGSYSIHNPVLLAKRNVLLRGQMVAYYHG